MITIFAAPAHVHVPDFAEYKDENGRMSFDKMNSVDEKFAADLEKALRSLGYTGKLTGRVWRYPVADGAAEYMVAQKKGGSVALVHMPLGDAYQIPVVVARGLRQQDVKDECSERNNA